MATLPNATIYQLAPAANPVTGADLLEIDQAGSPTRSSGKVTVSQLLNASLGTPQQFRFGDGSMATLPKLFYSSRYSNLSTADAAAVSNTGGLIIDSNYTLGADTTLTSDVTFYGLIGLSTHNLTLNGSITSARKQIFDVSGGGGVIFGTGGEINPNWYGASPDIALPAAVKSLTLGKTMPPGYSDYTAMQGIYLPGGNYTVTATDALGGLTPGVTIYGYKMRGDGLAATNIYYAPPGGNGILFQNNWWLEGQFDDMGFGTNSNTNVFMQNTAVTVGAGAVQGWRFQNINWYGSWKYIFDFFGGNDNSDFSLADCRFYGVQGTILHVGNTGTSNQFKNYFLHRCLASSFGTGGTWIDMSVGGGVSMTMCTADQLNSTLIYLRQTSIDQNVGQYNFDVDRLYMEPIGTSAQLINCQWPTGAVSFKQVDMSSGLQVPISQSQVMGDFTLNNGGPIVTFESCQLVGRYRFTAPTNPGNFKYSVTFRDCQFPSAPDLFPSASNAVVDIEPAGGSTDYGRLPVVRLRGCKGNTGGYATVSAWQANHAYSVGNFAIINGYTWQCSIAGTSAATQPYPSRAFSFVDGTVTWIIQDNLYPASDYAHDANVKYNGAYVQRQNLDVMRGTICEIGGKLPMSQNAGANVGYNRIILPPNHVITRARIYVPANVAVQTTAATFVLRNDTYTPTTLATLSMANFHNGGDLDQELNYWTGTIQTYDTDLWGQRSIILQANTNVGELVGSGAYCYVEYM